MNRLIGLALFAIALGGPASSRGQLVATHGEDAHIYQMLVTPASEPVPRLRHRLVAADADLKPGNATTFWYRAMIDWARDYWRVCEIVAERSQTESDGEPVEAKRKLSSVGQELLDAWREPHETTLSRMPVARAKEATELLLGGRRDEMVEAALRETTDWDLGVRRLEGHECYDFLLLEFQPMRSLSRVMCLDARVAIAERRLDDALHTLGVNFELAMAAAEPPLFVCRLIGGAIAQMGFETLRDFQCHPEAPSLYWALADLPRPLIDRRESIRFESGIGERMYALIRDPESVDRTDREWGRLLEECLDSLADQADPCPTCNPPQRTSERAERLIEWIAGLRNADRDHPGVRLATRRLRDRGYTSEELAAMPIGRLLAIDAVAAYRTANDAVEAAFQLPWIEGAAARDAAVQRLNEAAHPLSDSPYREVLPIATLTAAATKAASRGIVRQQQTADVLRLVEALRLHAGETGSLPASLDEINCVPVPRNPATGRPFRYQLDDDTATIELPTSDRLFPIPVRYKVRLAE